MVVVKKAEGIKTQAIKDMIQRLSAAYPSHLFVILSKTFQSISNSNFNITREILKHDAIRITDIS
jgi:hypothetical protein